MWYVHIMVCIYIYTYSALLHDNHNTYIMMFNMQVGLWSIAEVPSPTPVRPKFFTDSAPLFHNPTKRLSTLCYVFTYLFFKMPKKVQPFYRWSYPILMVFLPTQNPFKITQQSFQQHGELLRPAGPAIKWTSSPCPWALGPAMAKSFITGWFVGLEWMIHKLYSWGY